MVNNTIRINIKIGTKNSLLIIKENTEVVCQKTCGNNFPALLRTEKTHINNTDLICTTINDLTKKAKIKSHRYDKTGKSTVKNTSFRLDKGIISIGCTSTSFSRF